jgi:hypothetical protein
LIVFRYGDDDVERDHGLTFNALDDKLGKRIDYIHLALEASPLSFRDISLIPSNKYVLPVLARTMSFTDVEFETCLCSGRISSLLPRITWACYCSSTLMSTSVVWVSLGCEFDNILNQSTDGCLLSALLGE